MSDTPQLWMIRKKSNHILGPLEASQVKEMVEGGLLEGEDELCPENGFWFMASDVQEVKKYFGLKDVFVRKSLSTDGEPTIAEETQTADIIVPAGAGDGSTGMIQRPAPAERLTQSRAAELQANPALSSEELANRFKRPNSAIIGLSQPISDEEPRSMERSKVWLLFVAMGLILGVWAMTQVVRLLKAPAVEESSPTTQVE